MKDDLISREEALEIMRSVARDIEDVSDGGLSDDYINGWQEGLETASELVEHIIAANAALKTYAHWEIDEKLSNGYIIYKCSNCEHRVTTKATLDEWAYNGSHKYCGSCGAEMIRKDGSNGYSSHNL